MARTTKKAKKITTKAVVTNEVIKLSPQEVNEKVAELRGEMTHYIMESISVSILFLLLFIGAPSVFPEIINPYLPSSLLIMQALVAAPVIFWILVIIGNMVRYFKILKLKDSASK